MAEPAGTISAPAFRLIARFLLSPRLRPEGLQQRLLSRYVKPLPEDQESACQFARPDVKALINQRPCAPVGRRLPPGATENGKEARPPPPKASQTFAKSAPFSRSSRSTSSGPRSRAGTAPDRFLKALTRARPKTFNTEVKWRGPGIDLQADCRTQGSTP